jgi:hypothetical protein
MRVDPTMASSAARQPLAWLYALPLGVLLALASALALGQPLHGYLTQTGGLTTNDSLWAYVIEGLLIPATVPAFGIVGLIIAWRNPGNRIGWISLGLAGLVAVEPISWSLALRANVDDPGGIYLFWLANLLRPRMIFPPFALLLLVFPTGSLLSQRWRSIFWGVIVVTSGDTSAPRSARRSFSAAASGSRTRSHSRHWR